METHIETVITEQDWDLVVQSTYGRPYCLQQQDGCHDRGNLYITIPDTPDDFENDTVPEKVNHPDMGVSFKAWLARDPKAIIGEPEYAWQTRMWWERNFYPRLQMVANDLHAKGLVKAGTYTIRIDW